MELETDRFGLRANPPKMRFEAADMDRRIADVFSSFTSIDTDTDMRSAAESVDFEYWERWGERITDELVNGESTGAFTGGVAEFKSAYALCQVHHAVAYPGPDGETLREWMEAYRSKAHRLVPGDPVPDVSMHGGDLLAFLGKFSVKQMLAYGW